MHDQIHTIDVKLGKAMKNGGMPNTETNEILENLCI